MTLTNRAGKDGAKYFGPFGGRSQTYDIISTISKALLLPDCSRKFPRDIGKERPCLNYHMGSCAGWCLKDSSAEDYRRRITQAAMILDGKSKELTDELRSQMEQAAEELRFERAAELRDRLRASTACLSRSPPSAWAISCRSAALQIPSSVPSTRVPLARCKAPPLCASRSVSSSPPSRRCCYQAARDGSARRRKLWFR